MTLLDEERLRRRKQKFSAEASRSIINNPLSDVSLLSRSNNSSVINSLRDDPAVRDGLISDIEGIFDDVHKDHQAEHGLRKLREILSSLREDVTVDKDIYWRQTSTVYELSYNYYLKKGIISKLGGLVLRPIVDWFPQDRKLDFIPIYDLFLSHFEKDINKCVDEILKRSSTITEKETVIIKMANIYVLNSDSTSVWFHLYHTLSPFQQQFLKLSNIFDEMVQRSLKNVTFCYNQLSLSTLSELWFDADPTVELSQHLLDTYESKKSNITDDTIILFKKMKKSTA